MNTFYGVLASSFYRFTNLEIGSAITSFARETIKALISRLEKEGYKVIYGDTDSIFIESALKEYDDIVTLGDNLAKKISSEEGVIIEFEKVIDPFFSHGAKKRYDGKPEKYWKRENYVCVFEGPVFRSEEEKDFLLRI